MRNSPSVLFLSSYNEAGGTARVVMDLTKELRMRGHRIRTVFAGQPTPTELLAWCKSEGIEAEISDAVVSPREERPRNLTDFQALRRLVLESQADVVNIHYPTTAMGLKDLLAIRSARCRRLIVTIQHPVPLASKGSRTRLLARLSARLADAVIVSTEVTSSLLRETGIPPQKIRVVPLGLPVAGSIPTRREARARLRLPDDRLVVTCLARLAYDKGHDVLIDAFARIQDPDGRLLLVIAGTGPERERLEQLANERVPGRCRFLGWVENPADVYAATDVFSLASDLEGFGLVFVEAAFHKIPCVATAVGGVPYVIDHNRTGLLVPPQDPEALAGALQRLLEDRDLREQFGREAFARAHREFTLQAMTDHYAAIFGQKAGSAT